MKHADLSARRLRVGMVGGGRGAFIGAAHRIAVELDGQALVVAGALSADALNARQSAEDWYLQRSYASYAEMARSEAARPDGIDLAIIATPNHLHYPAARAFLESGIAVVCDKPLAHTLSDAEALADVVARAGQLFALTYNYSGYPAVREARERVRSGQLGEVRKLVVEYHQGWLTRALEHSGNKQADWRTDPARAGPGGCLGDIGTHACHLAEYVSGRAITALCADLSTHVRGRLVPDDAHVLLRLEGGGKGILSCSQIACGEHNALSLRVYGSRGSLEWHQENPVVLLCRTADEPWQQLHANGNGLSVAGRAASRLPAGHPEGYLEAFAVLYRAILADLRRAARGERPEGDYPGIREGLRGMRFIEGALDSASQGGRWVALQEG